MILHIFDLDGTLICSKHRQNTLPDGTLDLAHWIENNTPEKIRRDSLLPLGREYARFRSAPKAASVMQIACTARQLQEADHEFFHYHGLRFDAILSRPHGCTDSDVKLKDDLLREFARQIEMPFARLMKTAHFWDDNDSIREHFTSHGVICYNPVKYNEVNAA